MTHFGQFSEAATAALSSSPDCDAEWLAWCRIRFISWVLIISVLCKKFRLFVCVSVPVLIPTILPCLQHLFFTLVERCTWRAKVTVPICLFPNRFSLIISGEEFGFGLFFLFYSFSILCSFFFFFNFNCPDITPQWTRPLSTVQSMANASTLSASNSPFLRWIATGMMHTTNVPSFSSS